MGARVTVIMPAHNVAPYIGAAIESVLAQSISDWRLNVADDGSADGTIEVVEKYLGDERITLLRRPKSGLSRTRNAAIDASDTPYVAMLDSDDMFEPDYLEHMTAALDADADAAFACCDAWLFINEQKKGERASEASSMTPPITFERVLAREFQIYGETTVRRDWMDKAGAYDTTLRSAEDFNLWLNILGAGGRGIYVDKPLAWYRGRPDSLSRNTVQLHEDAITVYERFARSHPHCADICNGRIRKSRYQIALEQAKAALAEKRFDDFFSASGEVFENGENPKLRAVVALAKVSPELAHSLFSRR